MIGLTGAHRTGKSTLALAFAGMSGVPYLKTTASATFQRLNRDPQKDYPFEEHLFIQNIILDDLCDQWASGGGYFITDRTPICCWAYTIARVQRETMTPEMDKLLHVFRRKCQEALSAYFRMLFVVQPGIPLVHDDTKAQATFGFTEHISDIILGSVVSFECDLMHIVPKNMTNLNDRVGGIYGLVRRYGMLGRANTPVSQSKLT